MMHKLDLDEYLIYHDKTMDYLEQIGGGPEDLGLLTMGYSHEKLGLAIAKTIQLFYEFGESHRLAGIVIWTMLQTKLNKNEKDVN